jgi:predicted cupin superfamily sugar epimerase
VHPEAEQLVRELRLRPHPEGGYFVETYRSEIRILSGGRERSAITSIEFLLTGDDFSAFHRLTSDEIWHHYAGGPVAIETIAPDGMHRQLVIGDGERRQAAVSAGSWFAAHLAGERAYALVGCDVAPGFEFEDFEVGSRAAMLREFPGLGELVTRWALPE